MAMIPTAVAAANQALYEGWLPEDDGSTGEGVGSGCDSGSSSGDGFGSGSGSISGDGFGSGCDSGSGSGETAPADGTIAHFVIVPSQSHVQSTSSMGTLPKESIFWSQLSFGQVKHCPSWQIWLSSPPKTTS
jgi:hypothetical protein